MISGQPFVQTLLLLGSAVAVVYTFRRLGLPSSLGYLLLGLVFGPHTGGPVVDALPLQALAEFGIVFLLFTIGLSFSLPEIHALRHLVLGLGTAQVALTTLAVMLIGWAAGLPLAAAFVVGAVFAQSSTTIIARQLAEQREEHGRHARLGVAMSVFQDVTAVPFVIVIPVLATASAASLGTSLGWALAKAILALVVVVLAGRWLLHALFRHVARGGSAELFTLTVLFVSLTAGALTYSLGLSMAFGAFLAGMVLGETEFRHQVEATIRPFRDVLLGLFFVGIGMLIAPSALAGVWAWALVGTLVLMGVKTVLVAGIVRWAGVDPLTAWRTGLLLAVGGEFGFALLALGLQGGVVDEPLGQAVLGAVLGSMLLAPLLIRFNHPLALRLAPRARPAADVDPAPSLPVGAVLQDHVILLGYGRVGQSLGHILEAESVPWVALDLDATRVREARLAGQRVHYGDGTQMDLLAALGLATARLVVVTHGDDAAAQKTLRQLASLHPALPVLARATDVDAAKQLREAGASAVFPETLEASLAMASHALRLLEVSPLQVEQRLQAEREGHYAQLGELFPADPAEPWRGTDADQLHAVQLRADCPLQGRRLDALDLQGVLVTAIVRDGRRLLRPPPETVLQAGDTLVLFGAVQALARAEGLLMA